MMSIFRDQVYNWNGVDYPIPANAVMRAIGMIEEVVSLPEILAMQAGRPKLVKLADAFAAVLNYSAGILPNRDLNLARVNSEAVYLGLFENEQKQKAVGEAISTLMLMMVPPSVIEKAAKEEVADAAPGNVSVNRKTRRKAASSKKRSK